MKRRYPIRHKTHNLAELSERYFIECLPRNWVAEKPKNDYGVDLRVDIFADDLATGLELLVQLKASGTPAAGDTEPISLKTTTYNHLWGKLQVVMLVKYIESENEAYWLLLSKVAEPNQDQDSFTVHIPKTNRLSAVIWDDIHAYVREVTDEKLAARRAKQLQNG